MLQIDENGKIEPYTDKSTGVTYLGLVVKDKTNLQYALVYPENMQDDKPLIVESLNKNIEDRNIKNISDQEVRETLAASLTDRIKWVKDAPILMPIVPHDKTYTPYYQQLSRDCFTDELAGKREFERIDLQYLDCIQDAKDILRQLTGKRVPDKVFINGYSSSGVFAQRFALIHPEVVDKCCVGGSAGSIPIPEDNIGYPVGIADFKELFGKEFNEEAYKNIEFAYYVGEHEASNPGNWDIEGNAIEKDEHGNKLDKTQIEAPMHDMSYHGHSTPKDIGEKQREVYGRSLNDRFKNSIQYYKEHGYKIVDMIYKGTGHRSMFNSRANRFAGKVIKDIIDFYRGNPAFEFDSLSSATELDMSEQHSREIQSLMKNESRPKGDTMDFVRVDDLEQVQKLKGQCRFIDDALDTDVYTLLDNGDVKTVFTLRRIGDYTQPISTIRQLDFETKSEAQGYGYATKGFEQMISAIMERQDISEVYIDAANPISGKIAEKFGLESTELGRYVIQNPNFDMNYETVCQMIKDGIPEEQVKAFSEENGLSLAQIDTWLSIQSELPQIETQSYEAPIFTPPSENDLGNGSVAENTNNGEFRINEFGEIERPQTRLEALSNQKKELESLLREKQYELETKQANISPQQRRESYEKSE